MFNLYTYEKMQQDQEKKQKEKLQLEKYFLKRKSKYLINDLWYRE